MCVFLVFSYRAHPRDSIRKDSTGQDATRQDATRKIPSKKIAAEDPNPNLPCSKQGRNNTAHGKAGRTKHMERHEHIHVWGNLAHVLV